MNKVENVIRICNSIIQNRKMITKYNKRLDELERKSSRYDAEEYIEKYSDLLSKIEIEEAKEKNSIKTLFELISNKI